MCKLICCDLAQWIVGCINSIKFMNRRFRFELIHDHKLYRYKHCVVTMMNKSWHNVQDRTTTWYSGAAAVWRNNGGKIKTSCLNIVKSGWNILSAAAAGWHHHATQSRMRCWHTEGAATASGSAMILLCTRNPDKAYMQKWKHLHQNSSRRSHLTHTFPRKTLFRFLP